MLSPTRAAVRPRIFGPETGEVVLLEDVILSMAESGVSGSVRIDGPLGWGKSTALKHLASVVCRRHPHVIIEESITQSRATPSSELLVFSSASLEPTLSTLRLAPWGIDEILEYLEMLEPKAASAILKRVDVKTASDVLGGSPDLWCIVLEQLLLHDDLTGARAALLTHVSSRLKAKEPSFQQFCSLALARLVEARCWDPEQVETTIESETPLRQEEQESGKHAYFESDPLLASRLGNPHFRLVLAAERIVQALVEGDLGPLCTAPMEPEFISAVANRLRANEGAQERLASDVKSGRRPSQPMAASLLHALNIGWYPKPGSPAILTGARLSGINWECAELGDLSGVDLSRALLDGASVIESMRPVGGPDWTNVNLVGTRMRNASLDGLQLRSCSLDGATLEGASAVGASFRDCSLRKANLSGACIRQAKFRETDVRGASLRGADLCEARLDYLDLRTTDLKGAVLVSASMRGVNMEASAHPGLRMERADLQRANLTNACLRAANLRSAMLSQARLAFVDLSHADLRDVNFLAASFHLGSTRSGLLAGAPASWGTRTGFYADPAPDESEFAPNPACVADLRGADLRGAQVERTDFYRVDLRGATFTREQGNWFRECKAILDRR